MAADLFYLPFIPILSTRGLPSGAAEAYFYLSGTATLAPIYADVGMTTPLSNPVSADNFGRLPNIYLNDALTYRFYVVDAQGEQLYNVDPYIPAHPFQGPPGGNIMAVGTLQGLAGMVVPAGTNVIRTTGFYADGDGGAAFYRLMPAGTANGVGATADGKVAVYLPEGGVYNILAFGAKPDNATDCTAAFNLCMAQVSQGSGAYISGPRIKFPAAANYYYFASTISLKKIVILEGDGTSGISGVPATTLRFAANTFGIVVNRYDTLTDQVISPTTTAADGSIIRGMQIVGAGTDTTKHGIWLRARATIEDVRIGYFPGNNINIVASTGTAAAGTNTTHGNANSWQINRVTVLGSGAYGCLIAGTDANAGTSVGLEVLSAGWGGLVDISFLGNTHIGTEVDSTDTSLTGRVYDAASGHYFALVSDTPNIGQTVAPAVGVLGPVWYDMGTGGSILPAWSATGTYNLACGIYSDNPNARSVFIGPYLEGGVIGRVLTPCLVYGQQGGWTQDTPFVQSENGVGGFISSNTGHGSFQYLASGDARGSYAYTSVNFDSVLINNQLGPSWRIQAPAYDPTSLLINSGNTGGTGLVITGSGSTLTFGRSAAVPYIPYSASGMLGIGNGSYTRIVSVAPAIPTSGNAAQGEIVINPNTVAGGIPGWRCTTAGVNGSTAVWKAMANLAS